MGKFFHHREPADINKQTVVRMNRDTLYSFAAFDLDAGPVTIKLPDAGKRFRSMQIVDEDQYTHEVVYDAGSYTLDRKQIGTRYVAAFLRTLVDPNDQRTSSRSMHQDATTIEQASPGKFEVPNWDLEGQKKIREALAVLGSTMPDSKRTFGSKDDVDSLRFQIGAAVGWGGNPEKDATYIMVNPPKNDGKTIHTLTVKDDVPVDGFWSISVYNAEGFFEKNDQNAYSVNNITAKKESDGSIKIQFGGCDKGGELPADHPGWNCVCLYRRVRRFSTVHGVSGSSAGELTVMMQTLMSKIVKITALPEVLIVRVDGSLSLRGKAKCSQKNNRLDRGTRQR